MTSAKIDIDKFAEPLLSIHVAQGLLPSLDSLIRSNWKGFGKAASCSPSLWRSVCIALLILSTLGPDFEVYVIADACGDFSEEAHERAMARMVQAGGCPNGRFAPAAVVRL